MPGVTQVGRRWFHTQNEGLQRAQASQRKSIAATAFGQKEARPDKGLAQTHDREA